MRGVSHALMMLGVGVLVAVVTTTHLAQARPVRNPGPNSRAVPFRNSEGSGWTFSGATEDWGPANITTVHVLFSNHLDVGFDGIDPTLGFAYNVINRYFTEYFPAAVATAKALKKEGRMAQLKYMTHAWLVSLYLDCVGEVYKPLFCPSDSAKEDFRQAVRDGFINWHAFPFNAQAEVYDQHMFTFGVEMARDLALREGMPGGAPITMSQRDVPGTAETVIPLLNAQGVQALAVGVNGGSAPPAVPRIFRWHPGRSSAEPQESQESQESSASATPSLLTMYHPGGYGGIGVKDCIIIPGFPQAMCEAFRGDNAGPANFSEVRIDFVFLQLEFTQASIQASTYDTFVSSVLGNPEVMSSLPVVRGEIGDSWIKGVASDPLKLGTMRAVYRARTACVESGDPLCVKSPAHPQWTGGFSEAFYNFSRVLLKTGEHTWGGDMKKFLKDWDNWSNEQFTPLIHQNPMPDNYHNMIQSWIEQRTYIDKAMSYLPTTSSLYADIVDSWTAMWRLYATDNPLQGYTQIPRSHWGQTFTVPGAKFTVDGQTGALNSLVTASGSRLAGQGNPLGLFEYQAFDESSYDRYMSQYLFCKTPFLEICIDIHEKDFAKPNVSEAHVVNRTVQGSLVGLWRREFMRNSAGEASPQHFTSVVSELSLPSDVVQQYGGAQRVLVNFTFAHAHSAQGPALVVEVRLLNKTATRIPEAGWLSFVPPSDTQHGDQWRLYKLGQPVDPTFVVFNGSRTLHGLDPSIQPKQGGVRLQRKSGESFSVLPVDAALVAPGAKSLLNFDNTIPDMSQGVHFNLFNNLWGTNYIFWYPFLETEASFGFRFNVHWD